MSLMSTNEALPVTFATILYTVAVPSTIITVAPLSISVGNVSMESLRWTPFLRRAFRLHYSIGESMKNLCLSVPNRGCVCSACLFLNLSWLSASFLMLFQLILPSPKAFLMPWALSIWKERAAGTVSLTLRRRFLSRSFKLGNAASAKFSRRKQ